MKCPRDGAELVVESSRGIEIDRCNTCEGHWLDYHELDQLEDEVFSDDDSKGTVVYSPHESELECPICGDRLTSFFYRAGRIHLDKCHKDHGFWLDRGEDKEILDFMRQRSKNLSRSASAEVAWQRSKGPQSRGLLGKVKRFFTGR